MANEVSLVSAYIALGGAFIGAVTTFFPTYWIERYKENKEARMTTVAVITEIESVLSLLEKRQYVYSIKSILDKIRSGEISGSTYRIIVPADFCIVYKRNIERLGLLPNSIRKDVIEFHQLLDAVICDVRPGGLMAEKVCGEVEFAALYMMASEIKRIGGTIISHKSCQN